MHRIILTTLTLLCSITSFAQSNIDWSSLKFKNDSTEAHSYQITLVDETIIYGELIRLTSEQLFVETAQLGVLPLEIDKITSISIQGGPEAEKYHRMIGAHRYLLAPSPYSLEEGEFNFQVSEIFLLTGWYGVTENFSLGAGFTVLPNISFNEQLFYVIPKFSFELTPGVRTSVQFNQIFVDDENTSLLTFTTGFGRPDNHVSIGYTTSLSDNVGGAINFGGIARVSRRFGLVADIYLFPDVNDANLIGIGGRFIGKNSSFDFGFVSIPDADTGAIPWINYTVRL